MNKWVYVKEGNKYVLTELGMEVGRIRVKFEESSPHKSQYEKAVPQSWVDKGYVVEVPK